MNNYSAILWVGLGGFVGANARYWIAVFAPQLNSSVITNEHATFFVNFTGSLLLAIFLGWFAKQSQAPDHIKLLIGTGFFGSYTTFSTFSNETMSMFRLGHWQHALGYVLMTNILALLGVGLGIWFVGRFL